MPLYHYCGTESFFKIIATRSICLSSMILSNDSQEGRLLRRILERKYGANTVHFKMLGGLLQSLENSNCLAFCLSREKDRLSQWRGYADDGGGFSIGFNEKALKNLAVYPYDLVEVAYTEAEQDEMLQPLYGSIDKIAYEWSGGFDSRIVNDDRTPVEEISHVNKQLVKKHIEHIAITKLFALKHVAFSEEKETRLMLSIGHPDIKVQYRPSGRALKPYCRVRLSRSLENLIVSVHLGPKNPTPKNFVEDFLNSKGFNHVDVIPSEASYR